MGTSTFCGGIRESEETQSYTYRNMIAPLRMEDKLLVGTCEGFSGEKACDCSCNSREAVLLEPFLQDFRPGIQTADTDPVALKQSRKLRDQVEKDVCRRVAAILHDVIGQSIQSVHLGLRRVRAMVEKDTLVPLDLLDQIVDDVGATIHGLRHIGCDLRPLYLEQLPFAEAIRWHCREIGSRAGIHIGVRVENAGFDPPEHIKEQCFLGFREALSNALRHANASRIDVLLNRQPGRLRLTVVDDGSGFDLHEVLRNPNGFGLSMIRERAESVCGQARIRSSPGRGTLIQISIPLDTDCLP
jgi:signal transduction histidine kinase